MNYFEQLVADLAAGEGDAGTAGVDMAKSTAAEGAVADDKKDAAIAAAGAEGAAEGDEGEGDEGEGEGDGEVSKSFKIKLDDGTEVDAIDGGELIKSLTMRVENLEGVLAKAFRKAEAAIAAKDEMIKSLQSRVEKIGSSGRGRKAVVTIAAVPATVEEKNEGVAPGEFLAKSTAAHVSGKITGEEVSRIEAYINRGMQPPTDLVAKVLS